MSGSIAPLGDVDTWTFSADAGESFQLRLADLSSSLFPRVDVFAPGGALLTSAQSSTVAAVSAVAPSSGTYTVQVSDNSSGGATGPYALDYVRAPGADEFGSLPSGNSVTEAVTLGDLDTYTVDLVAGQAFQLRLADTTFSFFPRLDVYDPVGAFFAGAQSSTVAAISDVAPVTGTYTILVSDNSSGNAATGPYELHYAALPSANELGPVPNVSSVVGELSLGDLDTYKLELTAGESFQLRLTDSAGSFFPRIDVYDPLGAFFTGAQSSAVAAIAAVAPASGTFTVLISDNSSGNAATGPYELHFAAPAGANELGPLVNGSSVSEELTLGDLDTYSIDLVAGESFQLRLTDTAFSFFPRIDIYDPLGAAFTAAQSSTVAAIAAVAPSTGTFTVLVSDNSSGNASVGPYELHYAQIPDANELGPLPNGTSVGGDLTIGDLDTYTMDLVAGQNFQLRLTDSVFSFFPRLDVYDPLGAFVTGGQNSTVAAIAAVAPVTGTYRVLVSDNSSGNASSGPYELHYAQLPDANELGALPNGDSVSSDLTLGDLDTYQFAIGAGERFQLRLADTAFSLFPRLDVYDPLGAFVTGAQNSTVAAVNAVAPVSGTYTVLVSDNSSGNAATGPYDLHFARIPGANEKGSLFDGLERTDSIGLGDLDTYTFQAMAVDMVNVTVTDLDGGSLFPRVELYDPLGKFLTAGQGSTTATLAFTVATGADYTVVVSDNSSGNAATGNYSIVLTGSGAPPGLTLNALLPAQLPGDPLLTDVGGDPNVGPRIGDPAEPFNFALDCSGADAPSIYLFQATLGVLPVPLPASSGSLYLSGPTLLVASGLHSQSVVTWFPAGTGLVVPDDAALVGLSYATQAFVGGFGTTGRLSNGILQSIGL